VASADPSVPARPPWSDWLDRTFPSTAPTGRHARVRHEAGNLAQVFLGLFCVGFGVVVLAEPTLSITGLLVLLAEAVALLTAQTLLAGGRLVIARFWVSLQHPRSWLHSLQAWGVVAVARHPALVTSVSILVLAVAVVSQGLARILVAGGVALPTWYRGSTLGLGIFTILVAVLSIAFYGYAITAFAVLVGVLLVFSGIEGVVVGLHPTDPRQIVLLKLILFAAFYGLILINWIDLFGKSVPGYGVWLIMTYMAPFAVLLVFQGWRSWPLAVSLGLLVSLFNDVGYFFVGNLIFGFHENLGPWILGQLGFLGNQWVTTFQGGTFSINVTSWMMGLSIYLRALVVGLILVYWWRHPGEIVARTDTAGSTPEPAGPVTP
jgi:uncharacterized membrane protein HdeD (DUF308 family)